MLPSTASPRSRMSRDTVESAFHAGNAGFWGFFFLVNLPANFATLESRLHALLIDFATISTAWALCYGLRAVYRSLPPITSTSVVRYFGRVVLSCIAAAIIWSGISFITSMAILGPEIYAEIYGIPERLSTFHLGLPILAGMFLGWSGLYLGLLHWQMLKRAQEEKIQAEQAATAAELARLRHQTSPHFLFNALNTVRAEVAETPRQAGETLEALCEFLHYRMAQPPQEEISLREELDGVRAYLSIISARFGSRVHWEINCEDDCLDRPAPVFCIQPLVENAIKHSKPSSNSRLSITIRILSDADSVQVTVSNTGHWKQPAGSGTGIANLERRLSHWTGTSQRVNITKGSNQVTIGFTIPARQSLHSPVNGKRPSEPSINHVVPAVSPTEQSR